MLQALAIHLTNRSLFLRLNLPNSQVLAPLPPPPPPIIVYSRRPPLFHVLHLHLRHQIQNSTMIFPLHYVKVNANLIRTAAANYLLDSGVQWGGAPAVKGVRDAAVELLHNLVAVHAEVFSGAKPLLDKTLGILLEGLIDIFLSLFHENKDKHLRLLDMNGFCQLMLELEYFENILNPYFTPDARESLKSLQGVILEKATESATEAVDNPVHHRRPTRGSEDALADDRQQGMSVSPDDLIVLAQQYSSELLQLELERTRINTACFADSIPMELFPESVKSAYASFRGPMDSPSRNFRGIPATGSPSFSRQRRR